MPITTRYLFIASMDVDAEKEALFNEVYDAEHVPLLGQVPGVKGVTRVEKQDLIAVTGEGLFKPAPGEPTYSAIYEIESPEVLISPAWQQAGEEGRWPGQVRPYTRNRRHLLMKVIYPK